MERNLLAKRFIKGILYSKENIKISLFYPVRNLCYQTTRNGRNLFENHKPEISNGVYSEILKTGTHIERCGWAQKSPVPPKRDGASRRSRDWKNIISFKKSQFKTDNLAAGIRHSQTFTSFYQI